MKKVKLGDICEILNGYAFQSAKYIENGIRVIRITNVQKGYIEDTDPKFYDLSKENKLNKYLLEENDLLISLTGNVGRVGILQKEMLPAVLNQRVGCIRIKDKRSVNKKYLFHLLNNYQFEEECIKNSRGIAQKNLSTEAIKKYEIKLPSWEEQLEIVNRLDRVEEIVRIRKAQIEELNPLIKSKFENMFEETDFPKIKLGDEFYISSGGTPNKNKEEFWNKKDISWIGSNMCQNKILYENDGKYISKLGLEHSSAKIYPVDTVLVALVGATIGKTALLKFETATNQNIAGIQINNKFNAEYVYFAIQNLYDKFAELGRGNFKMANLSFIKQLEIASPPINLQSEFTNIVQRVDEQKIKFQKSLEEIQMLQESLVNQYFYQKE